MLRFEIVNFFDRRLKFDCRQGFWLPCKLFFCRIQMFFVNMDIAKSVNKLAWLIASNLRQDMSQQGVACDIERDSEENISASLIKMQGKFPVFNVDLVHIMTNREAASFIG